MYSYEERMKAIELYISTIGALQIPLENWDIPAGVHLLAGTKSTKRMAAFAAAMREKVTSTVLKRKRPQ